MKPVVSSLVALAIAVAPMTAFAKPEHKTAHHAKVQKKHVKAEKSEQTETKDETIVRVKAGKKDGSAIKPVHHAHNVDLGGGGHKEPKLVPASMTTKTTTTSTTSSHHGKTEKSEKPVSAKAMPQLPKADGKPSKGGAEKGARKASEKKNEGGESTSDGETSRDGDSAELVARDRGNERAVTTEGDPPARDSKTDKVEKTEKVVEKTEKVEKTDAKVEKTEKVERTEKTDARSAKVETKDKACKKDPIEVVRGPEVERFALTKCDGSVAPLAVEQLSVLIRPGGAARPTAPATELAKKTGAELAPGIRRVDTRLVDRIQQLADKFGKPGAPAKLFVISGYRPASVGSMHSSGRAIDLRVEGVKNEDVVAFCKTLPDTGCGYYPNSSFVHVDVRDAGAGHVTWIDASGPGETPRYVTSWPPPSSALQHTSAVTVDRLAEEGASLLRAKRPFEHDTPDASSDRPSEAR